MNLLRVIGCASGFLLLGVLAPGQAGESPSKTAQPAKKKPWAFRPVQRPQIPQVQGKSWLHSPIDAFMLAQLEKNRLQPAPAAGRLTLLRRVYLDLIGLPPTWQEVQAFLNDRSATAYTRVVDSLLARPEYGERWGRHWLDVARYAESNGYERDGAKPHAWRYRDYVIDSFNQDKPFDRFLTEQLAGDEMPASNAQTQIATTFLRLGTWDDEPAEPLVDRYDQLDDVLGTVSAAFLGVTLRCARCHNHKFDPFTQNDYYRMLAVFEPLKRPQQGRVELDRVVGTEQELAAYRAALAPLPVQRAALEKQLSQWKLTIRARLFAAAKLKSGGDQAQRTRLPAAAVAAFEAEPNRRNRQQKTLVQKFTPRLEEEIQAAASAAERTQRARLVKQLASLQATWPKEPPRAYIWYEAGPRAPVTRLFSRGDPTKPKGEITPGVPEVLAATQPEPPRPLAKSTGRRLWLARWLTRPDQPLTARVLVNRIWQGHFGTGIVATPNDFGNMGEAASHPQLLDWLAAELVTQGWRIKPLHRLIVLSSTYQMSSAGNQAAARIDPDGRLLWRWPQRRLEAEAVRDSILAVSGRLNPQMQGPSIYPPLPRAVLEGQSRPGDGWGKSGERQAARRSVYIFVKRVLAVPELELLDAPDTTDSCEKRPVSTTAPQALTFLNGDFIHQQARYFAAQLEREAGKDVGAQVRRAFEVALCRPPLPEEVQLSQGFLAAQEKQIAGDAAEGKTVVKDTRRKALEAFCLVLLNTNEFVYLN